MGLRIILAEDDALTAMLLADCLEAEGHSVVVAKDGVQALAAARGLDALDLLVTSLRMPSLSGEGLIRALWAERPGLPVVVITGSTLPGGAEALRRTVGYGGPLALLHKPFCHGALIASLRHVVAAPTAGRTQAVRSDRLAELCECFTDLHR